LVGIPVWAAGGQKETMHEKKEIAKVQVSSSKCEELHGRTVIRRSLGHLGDDSRKKGEEQKSQSHLRRKGRTERAE